MWVRIPTFPIELCNAKYLYRVGSKISTMLKIDSLTSVHSRARFARICVEIDLRKQLVPKIKVLNYEFSLEYEGVHLICFRCGIYGHREEMCSDGHSPVVPTPAAMMPEGPEKEGAKAGQGSEVSSDPKKVAKNQVNADVNDPEEIGKDQADVSHFGPWMLVKKYPKRKVSNDSHRGRGFGDQFPLDVGKVNGHRRAPNNKERNKGLRFEALNDEAIIEDGILPICWLKCSRTHNQIKSRRGKSLMQNRIGPINLSDRPRNL